MIDLTHLSGRTVVVTGASSGIGRGTALRLGELGANVVVAARREWALNDVVAEIEKAGGRAMAVPTDVADPAAVERLADAATDRFGRIDVWINNAGVASVGLFWEVPVEDHARTVQVNLTGAIYGAHAALRRFRAQGGGTLINVGSVESEVPLAYQASYAATKAGLLNLSRAIIEDLEKAGGSERIGVGTILPWAIDTPFWTHAGNYTGKELKMAAMEDPGVVIEAIVEACLSPKEAQPVGIKAKAAYVGHRVFANVSDRLSANIFQFELDDADPARDTSGSVHAPVHDTSRVDGGVREREEHRD